VAGEAEGRVWGKKSDPSKSREREAENDSVKRIGRSKAADEIAALWRLGTDIRVQRSGVN